MALLFTSRDYKRQLELPIGEGKPLRRYQSKRDRKDGPHSLKDFEPLYGGRYQSLKDLFVKQPQEISVEELYKDHIQQPIEEEIDWEKVLEEFCAEVTVEELQKMLYDPISSTSSTSDTEDVEPEFIDILAGVDSSLDEWIQSI